MTDDLGVGTLLHRVRAMPTWRVRGRLRDAVGPLLVAELPGASIGALCTVGGDRLCEIVGLKDRHALLVPLESTEGVPAGARVDLSQDRLSVAVPESIRGRVLDGLGRPIDGGPPLTGHHVPILAGAPDPLRRAAIADPLSTGVRVLDGLVTLGRGQRIAIMAGSGVGKSTLLAMLARHVQADVTVICLLGERGREVREFVHDTLGEVGLARSVLVVATSDRFPAMQVKAALVATTIAEHFRAQGKDALLLVDSLTRLALAQRQIALASGEPPVTRGYTPSVFAMLPRLLERAGTSDSGGSVTGIYTVLVEQDDMNDPIADAVRGIVDGHVVLSRRLASHGHYPAIDVLASLSRLMNRIADPAHRAAAARVRSVLATWAENEDLIRLGAYRPGSSHAVDQAIELHPAINAFLRQDLDASTAMHDTLEALARLVPEAG